MNILKIIQNVELDNVFKIEIEEKNIFANNYIYFKYNIIVLNFLSINYIWYNLYFII